MIPHGTLLDEIRQKMRDARSVDELIYWWQRGLEVLDMEMRLREKKANG
jgi:hypothetical protein